MPLFSTLPFYNLMSLLLRTLDFYYCIERNTLVNRGFTFFAPHTDPHSILLLCTAALAHYYYHTLVRLVPLLFKSPQKIVMAAVERKKTEFHIITSQLLQTQKPTPALWLTDQLTTIRTIRKFTRYIRIVENNLLHNVDTSDPYDCTLVSPTRKTHRALKNGTS